MANRVKVKRTYTSGVTPTTAELGPHEFAVNWADGIVYVKGPDGTIQSVTLGGSGGGSYSLPTASSGVLGGIKVGANLTITDGVLAATGGGGSGSIVTAATVAGFPATGSSSGTLYLATDTARAYIWAGAYIEVGVSGGGTDVELRALFTPAAPTSVTATGGNAQAVVSWTAPSVLAQTPITDYTVQYSSNSGSSWTTFADAVSTATSATVTGLTNGTAYTFRVAAVNALGQGAWSSASSSVTPASASGITMGNRYVGGVLGAYSTWTISGAGTAASPMVGAMRGDDASSEWRFTALASGTLSITARNVSGSEGWGSWVVRTVAGSTTIASGDNTLNYATTTASVTAGTQYAVFTALSGVDFSMSIS